MPFIVTARWSPACCGAVATLEEAITVGREALAQAFDRGVFGSSFETLDEWLDALAALPASGGSVGPLPDGTVIVVELTNWARLVESAEFRHQAKWRPIVDTSMMIAHSSHGDTWAQKVVLAAYNAAQTDA